MPIRTISDDISKAGTAVISEAEDIAVADGVTVTSTAAVGIYMTGVDETVFVHGHVRGFERGVSLGTSAQPTVNQGLMVSASGSVSAFGADSAAVEIATSRSMLINRGVISGEDTALLYSAGIRHDVTNYGLIEAGGVAIHRDSTTDYGRLTFVNHGVVTADGDYAYLSTHVRADDNIRNRGLIDGDISLGGSTDLYDGWGGVVLGKILGGSGTDTFILGKAAETVGGGTGTDTIDLRHGDGVTLSLTNSVAATCVAEGDRYSSIENVIGSRGADTILGSKVANVIYGGAGDDLILGGAGRDTLYGNAGNDIFKMSSALGVDFISDFRNGSGDNDLFLVLRSAFGLEAEAGPISAGNLVKGTAPKARDADDYVLFDTDDREVWIDRDGSGDAAATLIARLGTGTDLTHDDFAFV